MPTSCSCCAPTFAGMDGKAFVMLRVLVSSQNSPGKFPLSAGRAESVHVPVTCTEPGNRGEPLVPGLRAGLCLRAVPAISEERCFNFCLQRYPCPVPWVPICTECKHLYNSSFQAALPRGRIRPLGIPSESFPVSASSPLKSNPIASYFCQSVLCSPYSISNNV